MARIHNKFFEGTRGKIGNMVFKVRNGKTFVSALPEIDKNRKPTKNQLAAMEKFKQYSDYAKHAISDPELKPIYEAAAKKYHTAYKIAMKDVAHPPKVQSINADRNKYGVREKILIHATDDFAVKEVKVLIVSLKGKFIEEGRALQKRNSHTWIYETVKRNEIIAGAKITATATDYPGNTGELSITLS